MAQHTTISDNEVHLELNPVAGQFTQDGQNQPTESDDAETHNDATAFDDTHTDTNTDTDTEAHNTTGA